VPSHAAEQHKKTGIALKLSERSEFFSARLFCAAQGIPLKAEQVIGCIFFWFVFFVQAKKMNNLTL